ncbi:MAG: Nramp family divalent metal transporter [Acidobacteriota bacterium]|nr:Nramp family divalent metal transporter [Acidobacteriota bacterium]
MLGPGLAVAATGVGAGDVVAAAVAGSRFGIAVAWAAIIGAVFKFVLNEGIARWQLSTGTTLLEGWATRLGRPVQIVFLAYLILWGFFVGGALMSACGLAAHAIAPALSVRSWGALHSIVFAALVLVGGYGPFERFVKILIAAMFVALIGCAAVVQPPLLTLQQIIGEAGIPTGSARLLLGVVGGVGGTVTMLSYGYWIREKGWRGREWYRVARVDLAVAYGLTGLFGLAVMVLAAVVLHAEGVVVEGSSGVIRMGTMLGAVAGPIGEWAFRLGFWAAVATSMVGVWQGVPYLFADFVAQRKGDGTIVDTRSRPYRGFLLWLCLPPMLLLWFERPVQIILLYSILGAVFMPFLAGTLLYMNRKIEWVGAEMRSGWLSSALLTLALVLFGALGWFSIAKALASLAR